MLIQLRKRMGRDEGFTLIELLVVMLILGILAAIAIPTFFNQREKAQDSDSKAMARAAQTAIETYATDNGGSYAGATPAVLNGIENTRRDIGRQRRHRAHRDGQQLPGHRGERWFRWYPHVQHRPYGRRYVHVHLYACRRRLSGWRLGRLGTRPG